MPPTSIGYHHILKSPSCDNVVDYSRCSQKSKPEKKPYAEWWPISMNRIRSDHPTQPSYKHIKNNHFFSPGCEGGIRTHDSRINSPLPCRLATSHSGCGSRIRTCVSRSKAANAAAALSRNLATPRGFEPRRSARQADMLAVTSWGRVMVNLHLCAAFRANRNPAYNSSM